VVDAVRRAARHAGLDVISGVHGHELICILGGTLARPDDPVDVVAGLAGQFGAGPVVVGPVVDDLAGAARSVGAARAGLRSAAGWPDAPRPVAADDLLPERALDGDAEARQVLVEHVYRPLEQAGSGLLETAAVVLEQAPSLEAAARALFVHANTVRYRLRRIAEVSGLAPTESRDAFTLRVALTVGRLDDRTPTQL
jgi:DNA-binding PucR family transcriptional regulator